MASVHLETGLSVEEVWENLVFLVCIPFYTYMCMSMLRNV